MQRSFYNGISGIKTQSFGMDVWANNISNLNNAGFKSSTPEYKSIFYQSLAQSGGMQPTTGEVGLGAMGQTTALNMSMGTLKNTNNDFDFAVLGRGFFGVREMDGQVYYTRAGAFNIDVSGMLVDTAGRRVQGALSSTSQISPPEQALGRVGKGVTFSITGDEPNLNGTISDIRLPKHIYQPATPTTEVKINGSLDASPKFDIAPMDIATDKFSVIPLDDGKAVTIQGKLELGQGKLGPKPNDAVIITMQNPDNPNNFIKRHIKLEKDGSFKIENESLSWLKSKTLQTSVTLETMQEIPQTQKISTAVIGKNGATNQLDVIFTKQVPQERSGSKWSVSAKILSPNGTELASNESEVEFDSIGRISSGETISVGGISVVLGKSLPSQSTPATPAPNTSTSQAQPEPNSADDKNSQGQSAPLSFEERAAIANKIAQDAAIQAQTDGRVYSGIVATANGQAELHSKADGIRDGALARYYADDSGFIFAILDNGEQKPIAKLALYQFANEQGLSKMGANIYSKTSNSGEPFFFRNEAGEVIYDRGIASQKLELSNVSLATALTEVIATQKAYVASSKSITTSDEILQTTIQMKR